MSKPATFAPPSRFRLPRAPLNWLVAALLSGTAAASPEPTSAPALRPADQLDPRRIGTVPADEQAVLRLEFRSGLSREDENSSLQDMLTRLQRIESTVADITRLVQAMPTAAATSESPPVKLKPEESRFGPLLELANLAAVRWIAVIALLALGTLWWLRPRSRPAPDPAPPLAVTAVTAGAAMPAPQLHFADSPLWNKGQHHAGLPVAPLPLGDPPPAAAPAPPRIDVDLTDQTLELAEIMASLGLTEAAARTLTERIQNNPQKAVFHWLKLLDIYRNSGDMAAFQATADTLHQRYNIHADETPKVGADGTAPIDDTEAQAHAVTTAATSLEDFERIVIRISELCDQPNACLDYLSGLLEDNRDGQRTGFPRPVAEEILLLMAILQQESTEQSMEKFLGVSRPLSA